MASTMENVGHLREFNPQTCEWQIFKSRMENYFVANEIRDEERQRAILLNILNEEAYKLVFNLCLPTQPEKKKYAELLSIINEHFKPQQSVFSARYNFYSAKKIDHETPKEWAARLRSLAAHCQFEENLETALRDQFLMGYDKGAVQDRLFEEDVKVTFAKVIEIATAKMATHSKSRWCTNFKKEDVQRRFLTIRGSGRKFIGSPNHFTYIINESWSPRLTPRAPIGKTAAEDVYQLASTSQFKVLQESQHEKTQKRSTQAAKVEKKKKKANGYKLPDPLPPGEILEDIAKKKWKLGPSIGKGSFEEIYSAQEHPTTSKTYPYVIKIEPHANGPLFVEMHFYMRNAKPEFIEEFLKKKKLKHLGMPTYLGSGRHEIGDQIYRFVVMEKFGTDIWKLFVESNNKFPPETVFKLGVQILDVLEYVHSKGYVHANIKGANVLLGVNSKASQVYLVGFGLCTRYSQTDKPDPKKAHNGTLQYVSRDGHLGIESKRGDLEMLGYNLIQWLGCSLPWDGKNLKSPTVVQESKEKHMKNLPDFFNVCFENNKPPQPIVDYMKYVTSLKFDAEPDYKKLRNILIAGLEAAGSSLDSPFNFKSQKTPTKRRIKESSPVKKEEIVKKNKVDKPNPVNGTGKKSTKKTVEDEVSTDDSTKGFTEAMLLVKKKMKLKTQNNKEKNKYHW